MPVVYLPGTFGSSFGPNGGQSITSATSGLVDTLVTVFITIRRYPARLFDIVYAFGDQGKWSEVIAAIERAHLSAKGATAVYNLTNYAFRYKKDDPRVRILVTRCRLARGEGEVVTVLGCLSALAEKEA